MHGEVIRIAEQTLVDLSTGCLGLSVLLITHQFLELLLLADGSLGKFVSSLLVDKLIN